MCHPPVGLGVAFAGTLSFGVGLQEAPSLLGGGYTYLLVPTTLDVSTQAGKKATGGHKNHQDFLERSFDFTQEAQALLIDYLSYCFRLLRYAKDCGEPILKVLDIDNVT